MVTREEWVALIGYQKATMILLIYSGKSLYIPKALKEGRKNKLEELIGFDAFSILVENYGGHLLWIPRMKNIVTEIKKILGMPKVKLTRRSKHQINEDNKQLFVSCE